MNLNMLGLSHASLGFLKPLLHTRWSSTEAGMDSGMKAPVSDLLVLHLSFVFPTIPPGYKGQFSLFYMRRISSPPPKKKL